VFPSTDVRSRLSLDAGEATVIAVAEMLPGVRRVEHVMGMPIVVDVRDDVDEAGLDHVFAWFRWVDATFSTEKEDSEISQLARGGLAPTHALPEVRWVLNRCEELRDETRGYFDARATGTLDPSGLVKGWSIDRAAQLLRYVGIRNFAVSAGGDMCLSGRAVPELSWRVGIQHPLERLEVAAVVEANELAIATSGAYARGDHVVDPHTGRGLLPASSRSLSSARSSPPPTPMPLRLSRWAPMPGRTGRLACAAMGR
jgi:FAD:protein FMN transferase